MGIKELACALGTAVENEVIQIRADHIEMGEKLTHRINGVADRLKVLDGKVTVLDEKVTALDTKFDTKFAEMESRLESMDAKFEAKFASVTEIQTEMLQILVGIQSKLNAA
ncbi:hypothetical protein [Nonomuraea sp. NPDC002799]